MKLEVAHLPAQGPKRGSIVFLHGAWCWNWYWKPFFLPYFAANGYEAVAFSLRGHGASEGAALLNSFSIGDYVRDLASVVAGLDNPVIVGHSMGGFITQAYLTNHPAKGAVLLASAAPKPLYGQVFKALLAQPLSLIKAGFSQNAGPAPLKRDALRQQLFSRGPDDRSMDQYLDNIQAESYRVMGSMLTKGIRRPESIKTPLLVIGAGRDRLVKPDAVALTAATYHVKPVMFDSMSHMLMLEPGWRDVADQIIRFAASLPR